MDTDSKSLVPRKLFLAAWLAGVAAFLVITFLLSRFGMTLVESLQPESSPVQVLEGTEP